MRTAYNKIQKGMETKLNLPQDRIDRLEEIGFQWGIKLTFEKHYSELIAFKEDFGHCDVPQRCANNPSLGAWCNNMRTAYKKIQKKGMKSNRNLSQDRIKRLDDIGFQWERNLTFEKRYRELVAFKEEFENCNVPYKYVNNPSLGQWCSNMRTAYLQIQKGTETSYNLSQDRIDKLEDIGFRWTVRR